MNLHKYLFLALTLLFSGHTMGQSPKYTALAVQQWNDQFTDLLADTSITFEQVKPLFASWFAQKRSKVLQTKVNTERATEYVIVVTTDGFRWQELFGGADSLLIRNTAFVPDTAALIRQFWADDQQQRRGLLMPFFWGQLAQQGQVYGNRWLQNNVNVANNKWFSYPGYNEMLTGTPDDSHILTNMKIANPNTNVLEFLNRQRGLRRKVVAFSTWDVFPYILNEKRSAIPVFCQQETTTPQALPFGTKISAQLAPAAKPSQGLFPDENTMQASLQYLRLRHPKVAFISFDDTDHEAHLGHYDRYLYAAQRFDAWLAELWQFIQQDRRYRDHTTLLITTDHGRGTGNNWQNHSFLIPHSNEIWLAAIGPDTPALGELKQPQQLYQEQTAQTIAQVLGFNFTCAHRIAPPISAIYQQQQIQITANNIAAQKHPNAVSAVR